MAQWSRRRFLQMAGAATGSGLLGWRLPALADGGPGPGGFLTAAEITTLNAALARMIPASGPGDWSAADLGVATYIDNILSVSWSGGSPPPVFAGGPYRAASAAGPGFGAFQQLSRVKAKGWQAQISRWQGLYRSGLAALDKAAGGNFAAVPSPVQDAILEKFDLSNDKFFAVLYDHTMEGAYSHPVYGGNTGYRSWQAVGFAGDVHGVRFPTVGSQGAWNVYGGYAPEEIIAVGSSATEQPVTASSSRRLP
ncbi:MAG TPA: gluconate 2-dehydrogenase subunit 3 family protein [Acidimicrobiales bacterium]|nr:gluconate 2-dehydrogenase subunit 3 family protein [Acidimicrobiales bacterium]